MNSINIISTSDLQTQKIGQSISKYLSSGDIVCLWGDLGAGKTTFVKGLAKGLKVKKDHVNSPTFVFMNIYEGKLPLYHFDLYRVEHISALTTLGYEEFLYGDGITVIEWPERMEKLIPKEYLKIELTHQDLNTRRISIFAVGKKYQEILERISKKIMK